MTFSSANSSIGSEEMSLVRLIIPVEAVHDAVSELGELGNVQFKDVCNPGLRICIY